MTTQTDQRSLAVKPSEQQRKDVARSSPGFGLMQRRGEYPFGLMPHDLFRANPFSLVRRMAEEMDRMFQDFSVEREAVSGAGWVPAVEVENDSLVIQGERKSESEQKDAGVQRTERQYGYFYRSIPLPDGANVEQAQAKFHNGVLDISIPIPEQQSNRRSIPIQAESTASKPPQSQAA